MTGSLSGSGARAGWRVALRLARREALRRKGQTVLMLVLICLPVIAVTTAAIVWRTQDVSTAEGIGRRLGAADAVVESTGQPRVVQHFDPDVGNGTPDGVPDSTRAPLGRARVQQLVGPDRPMVPFEQEGLEFATAHGVGNLETVETDLRDPLAAGLLKKVSGTFPPGPGEVVVNQALADRGPGVGSTLSVTRPTGPGGKKEQVDLKVVGIAESTSVRDYPIAGGLPASFGNGHASRWLVGGGAVRWHDVRALNDHGLLVTSRGVLLDPPPRSELPPELASDTASPVDEVVVTVLALVGAMVLLEVVLLAGPAFAVRARAQAHTLALVAATGGTPGQARRTVLASGVMVGAVGGVLGVVIGIGLGVVAVPVAQRFNSTQFGPFDVPWLLLLLVAGFGLLSAVLAAVVPAFAASRQDVVAVLAGRRGEGRPSRRSPVLGLVLVGAGLAAAMLGSRAGSVSPPMVAGSAVVSVIGMILFVPAAVMLAARLAARLPLALRFATRDAARHRTRTVPAVAAVGATVAGVVALGIALSSQEAADRRDYTPQLPDGYASVTLGSGTDPVAAREVVDRALPGRAVPVRGVVTSSEQSSTDIEVRDGKQLLNLSYWSTLGSPYFVGTKLPDYVDVSPAERARAGDALAHGGAVIVDDDGPGGMTVSDEDGTISSPAIPDLDRVTLAATQVPYDGEATPLGSATVRSVVVHPRGTSPALAVVAPRVTRRLGVEVATVGLLVRGPVSGAVAQDVEEELAALQGDSFLYVERGFQPEQAVRIIQGVLAALGAVLMLGGTLTATFLALSDARPDLATMAAVGARPRTRRAVAASYAAVVGLLGAVLGAPVGFIPGVAISRPLTRAGGAGVLVDVPWLLVLLVVLGLPVLTAAVVGASARSRLPLVARVD